MKVGYARTSTQEQVAGLEGQLRDLKNQGCERIFQEHCSAVGKRAELEKVLDFVRDGDTLVVTHVDRLARDVQHLITMVNHLRDKNVALKIIGLDLDTSTPHGQLMLMIIGTIAEWERKIMLERQREGIEKARFEGKYKGKPPLPDKIKEAVIKFAMTKVSKPWIAKKVGIGVASVYRIITEHNALVQNPEEMVYLAAPYNPVEREKKSAVGYL